MKTRLLIKTRMISSGLFSRAYFNDLKNQDRLWVLPIAGAGIGAALFGGLFILIQNYRSILAMEIAGGTPEIVLFLSSLLSSVLIFLIGTPLSLSNIFYSKDNSLLLTLPVPIHEIILSRLATFYLFFLPVHLLINVPAVVLYLQAVEPFSARLILLRTIAAANLFITGPIPAAVLALAAAAILGAAGAFSGRKTAFEIGGMTAAIAVLGAVQLQFGRSIISGGEFSAPAQLLSSTIPRLRTIFFHSAWISGAFAAGGTGQAVLSAVFSLALPPTTIIILSRTFRLSLLNSEAAPHRRRMTARRSERRIGSRTGALVKREWTVICSNSAFLFEVIGEILILPILLAVFYFATPRDLTAMLVDEIHGLGFTPLVLFGVLVLFCSINSVSSTSISREGKTFALSKALPAEGGEQIRAKMIFNMILFLFSWYLNTAILMAALKVPPVHLLYFIPGGPAVILLIFITNISVDLDRPVLGWTHPQQAMKQNMNVLAGMGFGILVFAALAGLSAVLWFAGCTVVFTGIIAVATAAATDVLLLPRLFSKADRRYREIEI